MLCSHCASNIELSDVLTEEVDNHILNGCKKCISHCEKCGKAEYKHNMSTTGLCWDCYTQEEAWGREIFPA